MVKGTGTVIRRPVIVDTIVPTITMTMTMTITTTATTVPIATMPIRTIRGRSLASASAVGIVGGAGTTTKQ